VAKDCVFKPQSATEHPDSPQFQPLSARPPPLSTSYSLKREIVERQFPEMTDDEVMSWLWDQCDYGSAAVDKS
jgi:hypothetical protein